MGILPDEIGRVWSGNAIAGEQRFGGKTLHISGIIEDIDRTFFGQTYVVLSAEDTIMGVWIYLSPQVSMKEVAELSAGQRVTLSCVNLKDFMGLECEAGRVLKFK